MRYAIAILIALMLAGCGGKPSATAPVTVTLFTWTRPGELAANQDLRAKFEAAHPNIKVEIMNEPSDRAMDKLQAMVAAGNPPDVMSIHGAYFMPLAAKGALLDLDPYAAKDAEFDLADFYPSLVEICRYQGKLYSLPRLSLIHI